MALVMAKNELIDLLRHNNVRLKFTKTDGSIREMNCTLQEGVAVPYEKKTDREKKLNDDLIAVWDIDKSAWRSFKLTSIIEVYK